MGVWGYVVRTMTTILNDKRTKVAAGAVVGVAALYAIKKAVSPAKKGNENQRPQIASASETKEV